jgi:hypothetical protein
MNERTRQSDEQNPAIGAHGMGRVSAKIHEHLVYFGWIGKNHSIFRTQ